MPNAVHHSVFNIEENVALGEFLVRDAAFSDMMFLFCFVFTGDNYIYLTCLEEIPILMAENRLNKVLKRLDKKSYQRLKAVIDQMKTASLKKAAKKKKHHSHTKE